MPGRGIALKIYLTQVIIAHEMMHGYDVDGINYGADGTPQEWVTPEFLEKYTERTLCLRESHKAALTTRARQVVLNDIIDSENLADFVGTAVSYAAFTSLPPVKRDVTLPGVNLTAERLFFIGYCSKLSASRYVFNERYAPDPSRCIVPIMNMAEFSDAFGCAPGSRMNPSKKCAFWP
nr:neprilysin-1-like [Rhipicephalus microplus]